MFKIKAANRGFTLIEVLVTVTIISLLTVMGAVSYRQTAIASRDAKRNADLEAVRQALVIYKTDNGTYPSGSNFTTMLSTLSSAGAITSTQNIVDPRNVSPYIYSYSSNGTTFSLSVGLEKTGGTLTLTNP